VFPLRVNKSDQPAHNTNAVPPQQAGSVGSTYALLDLQRRAGNAAVIRALQRRTDGSAQAAVQRVPLASDQSLMALASQQPMRFLEEVFDGLRVDEFRFRQGQEGNLGLNMISQGVTVPLDGGGTLVVHLNCMVRASQLKNGTISLHVAQFHLTARSLATQRRIDTSGSSAATADASIHINTSTPQWGRQPNLQALAAEFGANDGQDVLIEALTRKAGYSHPYVVWLVSYFKERVHHAIQLRLGSVNLTWDGDATFSP
jgi:hypothetical protein